MLDNPHTALAPALPTHQEPMTHVPTPSLSLESSHQPNHAHMRDISIDTEDTPQASTRQFPTVPTSPRPPAPTHQAAPSQSNLVVRIHPKPFREHKLALQKLEEEYEMEGDGSEDSDVEEDAEIAIAAVKKNFASHPDLANHYANPKADNVQCPACNKLLSKTMFDEYHHAPTSRSKHDQHHRGVAAAIAAIFCDQDPPRGEAQIPPMESRPDRRLAVDTAINLHNEDV